MMEATRQIRKLKEALKALLRMASDNDNGLEITIEVREV